MSCGFMSHMKKALTLQGVCAIIEVESLGSRRGVSASVISDFVRGGCLLGVSSRKPKYLFPSLVADTKGGECMEYITWDDLFMIAMLIVAILSCYFNYMNNKKR